MSDEPHNARFPSDSLFRRLDDAPLRGPERRSHPRVRLQLEVQLRFASIDEVIDSRTVDLSRGGAFIRMTQPRLEGTRVTLQLEVGEERQTLHGIVVRAVRLQDELGPPGIGVMFVDLDDAQREWLGRLAAAVAAVPEASDPDATPPRGLRHFRSEE